MLPLLLPVRRAVLVVFALTAVALSQGCIARQPSAASPLSGARSSGTGDEATSGARPPHLPLSDSAWPARIPVSEVDGSEQEVFLLQSRIAPPDERTAIGPRGVGELSRVDVDQIASAGDLERIRRERGFREWLVFQSYLDYVSSDVEIAPELVGPDGRVTRLSRPITLIAISETSFAIYLPDGKPRGLVVQLTNLAGNTEWERKLTEALQDAGWAVLSTFAPDGWATDDLLAVDRDAPPEVTGAAIAAAVDDRLAEWAYGVEAMLDYMQERYPEVPLRPLVAVGSSAGAISLPAVAARLESSRGQRFDAAVMIGGGIDGLSVLQRTTLAATPFRLEWAKEQRPDDAQWAAIREAFLRSSQLDGTRTCGALRGIPVLLLHAAFDRIVDSSCGDALWEVLDRPERWTYQTGHLGLFVFWLPLETERVVQWLNAAVE